MGTGNYKAKKHYRQVDVAKKYEKDRIESWHGRLAHQNECRVLKYAIDKYFEPGGTVMDLPCGTGRLLNLNIDGGFRLFGCDVSEEMMSFAQVRFSNNPSDTAFYCGELSL